MNKRHASETIPDLAQLIRTDARVRYLDIPVRGNEAVSSYPWSLLRNSGVHELVPRAPIDFSATARFAFQIAVSRLSAEMGRLLWIQPKGISSEWGRPYRLRNVLCGTTDPLVLIETRNEKELLWAVEEAAAVPGLGAVIGIMPLREKFYGFTASQRLALRARESRSSICILRPTAAEGSTAALTRWRIASAPSGQGECRAKDFEVPGRRRWHVRLDRAQGVPPQEWLIEQDETFRLRLVDAPQHRPDAPRAPERLAFTG